MAELKRKKAHLRGTGNNVTGSDWPEHNRPQKPFDEVRENERKKKMESKKNSTDLYAAGDWNKPFLNLKKRAVKYMKSANIP